MEFDPRSKFYGAVLGWRASRGSVGLPTLIITPARTF